MAVAQSSDAPAPGREKRAVSALLDVVGIEELATDIYEVQTWLDTYRVDVDLEACTCPDYEYNLDGDGRCKHLVAARIEAGLTPVPTPDDLHRVATDGGSPGNRPKGHDQWTVWDPDEENANHYERRADAESALATAHDLGAHNATLYEPGNSPETLFGSGGALDDDGRESSGPTPEPETDGGQAAEVVEVVKDADAAADVVEPTDTPDAPAPERLGDRSVAEDPLNWVPGEFVDEIDGTQAINRKGFEVLSHFYDIDVSVSLEVPPEETDHEYCRCKAVAETPSGRTCEAFGSAHVDRGDDAVLLLEMASTRAKKRALSMATGVGAVAVEELKNEVSQ